ncbi:helicase-exonuclease AddAB subunit AddA [Robertmurraya sp. DFI.2.37]|uniref:helicase-exonuclease AddAB subunit AddA n=1 Tax=Robertmurraya sp. DFI.2.37 TaxID=3031819 RepID=UPI001246568B|nr:helicase-exonuclease AddAB subunit AddA [Robertmurraya sp. DFI.2.37]MDF1507378.1 helicase-exonuclease AddAB subunit AddA [Robertmurraya sp. DFI.2.37]
MKIPTKPVEATWTDDQWKAIWASGQDILVAAAAGSGKTAVLVERMINKIISTDEPIDVDELLVVTFTNASAAEMRHRIGEALEKAISDNPSSKHLRKQLSLLNRASISTLHSFCLEVIRKYYYQIDVDPGFRIADETEVQLLRDEVMEELFEDEYGKQENEAFFELVDTFSNDRSDVALQDIIREIYDFAQSNPSPHAYLQSLQKMYEVDEGTTIEELPFADVLLFDIELQLKGAKELLENGLELTKLPGGPSPRAENFIDDIRIVDSFLAAKEISWDELYLRMQAESFSRAKTCRGDEFDKNLLERAQKLRDKAKKIVQTVKDELFSRRPESFIRDIREMAPQIRTLVQLVESFAARFAEVKKEKGLVDFADLEHLCLQILSAEEGKLLPSEAAISYRNQFKEVFVDEYQDTNMVQEAILQLVTKDGEKSGNMFMVGDVKQSIYRFRLAEPNLFLGKYLRFTADGEASGLKIDLARNFRSRKEVLDGTNFLFKQLMGKTVGEIEYDKAAELVQGASYPESEHPIEWLLIEQEGKDDADSEGDEPEELPFDDVELEQSQLEARIMADKIKHMVAERKEIYNGKTKSTRPIQYRDIVILLRSMTWAPQIIEEFKEAGIPVYANLSTGYFEATEVSIMMSLLKIIDNPYQDIPLAAVLRSPIIGLNEEELAQVRLQRKHGSFYEALVSFCQERAAEGTEEIQEKLLPFVERLQGWRKKARQGALAELIWQLYRDTKFYDFVGGLPGGKQRQANLRALYDRARQYENTSFRGLFRFLRFIERMTERGDDLGAARALGEQEDVVRIMTIHSSKGLEFPIVFVAGTARQFNMMDLRKPQMLDKDLGFATKYINAKKRISYPSLPQLAFKRKKKLEMLAEEMRVLYVALTRAKEKLFLLSSVKELDKKIADWEKSLSNQAWLLKEYERAAAKSYLDWIGPALIRHKDADVLRGSESIDQAVPVEIYEHPSTWKIEFMRANDLIAREKEELTDQNDLMGRVYQGLTVEIESNWKEEIEKNLTWQYPFKEAARHRSKQSVSEMKRQWEMIDEESGKDLLSFSKPILNRPRFMQEKTISPAERGTAMHMVMQHVNLAEDITVASVIAQLEEMVAKELLTEEQKQVIDVEQIVKFFTTELGERMLHSAFLNREIPFNAVFPSSVVYPNWNGDNEPILVQGIIDCAFVDEAGLVLVDYKTDAIQERYKGGFEQARPILEERYRVQLNLYAQALEQILQKEVAERYLFFFDGGHVLKL